MRFLLLIIIKIYWIFIPENKRRRCLFKVSCSHYVHQKTKNEGLILGLKALNYRIQNCNSNYSILELNGELVLITKTNEVFKEKEINQSFLN